jgi:hypothetical protein
LLALGCGGTAFQPGSDTDGASASDASGVDSSVPSDSSSAGDSGAADSTLTDGSHGDAADGSVLPTAVSGAVQKGPFLRGSSVSLQELDATLNPTGRPIQVTTSDDQGDFTIPVNLTSPYVEVTASGNYFDELSNQSVGPLTLHALADLTGRSTVDVTLLTSMSAPLVRKLVAGGASFSSATTQAESAVLSALGFSASSLGTTFSSVGLTGMTAASGEALAASLIVVQYARSLGGQEVTELGQFLGQVGAATADSGGDAALAALHAALCPAIAAITPATVRSNLTRYYLSFGVTAVVPPFEQFLCGCGIMCGGADGGASTCVNPSTDPGNCGGCGVSCTIANASSSCVAGSCVHTCISGYSACGGATPCAYNTSSDSTHCGSSCVTCPSSSSCVGGACTSTGVCTPGATQCSGSGVQTCDSTGNWGVAMSCPYGCLAGTCLPASSDGGTVRYGFTTPLGSVANNSGNYLFGMAISVPMPITVTALGVITNATGGQFVMGLYSGTSGVPGTLIVAASPATATNGVQEFPVTPIAIAAGTYWMVASAGSAGVNHWGYAATGSDWASPYTYTGALPATAPAGTTYPNDSLNFYVVGQ